MEHQKLTKQSNLKSVHPTLNPGNISMFSSSKLSSHFPDKQSSSGVVMHLT